MDRHIIEKINKLLALSESPNEHEAFLAMEKANRLLKEYNMSMYDVKNFSSHIKESIISLTEHSRQEIFLFYTIAEWNECQCIISTDDNQIKNLHLIGLEYSIIITYNFINYILETFNRLLNNFTTHNKNLNKNAISMYKSGLIQGVLQKIKQNMQQATNEEKALVKKINDDIWEYLKTKYGNVTFTNLQQNPLPNVALWAYSKGFCDGKNINLHHQLAAKEE